MKRTMTITIRAKRRTDYAGREYLELPVLARRHCDMNAARQHPRYGAYANSDLFPGMLRHIRAGVLDGAPRLYVDQLPDNVTIEPGFLDTVTITV